MAKTTDETTILIEKGVIIMTKQSPAVPSSEQVAAIAVAVYQYHKEQSGQTLVVRPLVQSATTWTMASRLSNLR